MEKSINTDEEHWSGRMHDNRSVECRIRNYKENWRSQCLLRSSPKIKNIHTKKMFFKEQKIMRSAGVQVKGSATMRIKNIWKSQITLTRSTGQEECRRTRV